jgi:putative transposase
MGLSSATWRYERRGRVDNSRLLARLQVHAAARPRFGYRRLHTLIDREGVVANHKRVYAVYRDAGLQVRRRKRKRLTRGDRVPPPAPSRAGERWSMDFMIDTLADGRPFRTLNIVDDFTRECLAIEVDRSLPGARVVRVLERLRDEIGLPHTIVTDNGLSQKSRRQSFAILVEYQLEEDEYGYKLQTASAAHGPTRSP